MKPIGRIFVAAYCLLATAYCAEPTLTIRRGVVDGIVNVRDFRADGSDTQDDSAAIQAAIDAAVGPVYFPPGKYLVGQTLTITRPSITLFGFGDHSSRGSRPVEIKYTGKGMLLRLTGETSGFRMKGLFLTGPSSTSNTRAIGVETDDKFQSGLTLERVGVIQFGVAVTVRKTEGIKNRWLGKLLIRECAFQNNGQALVCEGSGVTNLDILQSEITQHKAVAGPVIDVMAERMAITGCNLEGQPRAIRVTDSHTVKIAECYLEGNEGFWLEAIRVQGLRFRDNYLRQLKTETYTEPVVLRECLDVVVERPTVNKGGWEIP